VVRTEKALDAKEYALGVFDIEGTSDNTSSTCVKMLWLQDRWLQLDRCTY